MNRVLLLVALLALTGVALAGCLDGGEEASASLNRVTSHGTGVGSTIYGFANFTEKGGEVTIRVEVWGLTELPGFEPGPKGTHIHEHGDCSPAWDGTSATPGGNAGGHFNPGNASHPDHAGDLGNMEVDAEGHGVLEVTVSTINLGGEGAYNVVGRSVVIHAGEDDLESQPSGASGNRMLCGVIRAL